MIQRDPFVELKSLSDEVLTRVSFSALPLYNKKSWWHGIRAELQEPEFKLSG